MTFLAVHNKTKQREFSKKNVAKIQLKPVDICRVYLNEQTELRIFPNRSFQEDLPKLKMKICHENRPFFGERFGFVILTGLAFYCFLQSKTKNL